MRRIVFVLMASLMMAAFGVPVQAATVWFPTESGEIDVNTLTFGNFDVAIFDDDDVDFVDPFVLAKPGDTVFFNFDEDNNVWVLTSSEDDGKLLELDESFHFVIALASENTGKWIVSSEFEKLAFGIYNVFWGSETQIAIIDAQPVPLPASILLLGTGLIGFISLRRRKG